MIDCHIHTSFSPDGEGTIEEYCRKATELNLKAICFTEHVDFNPRDESRGYLEYGKYVAAIVQARRKWRGRLDVRFGVEVGYQPEHEAEIRDFLSRFSFDFVLGSVHWVGPSLPVYELFDGRSMKEAYGLYFSEVYKAAKSGLFDVMAHLDFVKRYGTKLYGPFHFETFKAQIEEILKILVRKGIGLEINTSGLWNHLEETLPNIEIVRLYRELGGKTITIGSDAHRAGLLGFGLERAIALAKAAGFPDITVFEGRRPKAVPLRA